VDIIYWHCPPGSYLIARSSRAIGDRGDVTADENNSPEDGYVRVNYDNHWNHPSADEENKDEDPSC